MRVLIGTPIHQVKDYCMERWLENVSKLQLEYPADLLLADNSPGLDYVEKVKGYCEKYGIKNYKIEHLEIYQGQESDKGADEQIHERVTRCREIIRQEILSYDYDAWFSWECDQIIPTNALCKLVQLMKAGDFIMVDHNCWANDIPNLVNFDFGVTLIKREVLQKYSFIPKFGTDLNAPLGWYEAESWFRKRLLKDRCNYLEVEGLIEPIYHLNSQ